LLIGLSSLLPGLVEAVFHHRVEHGIDLLHPPDVRVDHVDARDLARANHASQAGSGQRE
jgi:hypothetical protein